MFKTIQKLLFLLFFLLALGSEAWAQPVSEVGKPVVLDLDETNPSGEVQNLSFPQQIANFVALGAYFDKEYPGYMISWDFTEDMRKFFPNLDGNELDNRVMAVRDAVRLYRYGRYWYDVIKQKLLLPEDPPLVYDEEDYEKPEHRPYIESDDLVVINDFKKVVSYSSQAKDIQAYRAKAQRDILADKSDTSSPVKKINDMFAKIGWKEFLFSYPLNDDPLTEGEGLGKWAVQDGIYVRLETEYATVNNLSSQQALLHFYLPEGKVLRLDAPYAPTINLSGDNLDTWRAFLPIFDRVTLGEKSYLGRTRHIPLALELHFKNAQQPLFLSAHVEAYICSIDGCKTYVFNPKLFLENEFGYSSLAYNFIHQSFLSLPKSEHDDFTLKSLSLGKNPSELHLQLETDENPSQLDVMLESNENISFEAPRMSVHDDVIDVFLTSDKPLDNLLGKTFQVTVKSSLLKALKTDMTLEDQPLFDTSGIDMSWALVGMAVLGGLLLNFMPCVLPILALKIMSVLRFGGGKIETVRRNSFYTLLGLFMGFSLLALFLSGLKFWGISLGWGSQFEKPWFLIFMIFFLVLFLFSVYRGYSWNLGAKHKFSLSLQENIRFFASGCFLVLMSTICSAPYLGTVLGFAFGSSYLNFIVLLYAVALGLSLPYLLFLWFPELVFLLPKPGRWMRYVERFIILLVCLTLLWLLSVLAAQISPHAFWRMVLYVFGFFLFLWGRHFLLRLLDKTPMPIALRYRKYRLFSRFFYLLAAVVFATAMVDISSNFYQTQKAPLSSSSSDKIDFQKIQNYLDEGKTVLLKVDARWCLTCKFNDFTVLNTDYIQDKLKRHNIVLLSVDWSSYNSEVLDFMKKYGRSGVPFYVLFSPKLSQGIVLPEILTEKDFSSFLDDYTF